MSLRVRFQYEAGASLGYSIEKLTDGSFFDFATGTFKGAGWSQRTAPLTAESGELAGRFSKTLAPLDPSKFTDGSYAINIHDAGNGNRVVGCLQAVLVNGDDGPTSSANDPWDVDLAARGYAAGKAGALVLRNLDAAVSTRSTFNGGAVASVTAPVTVGTVNDKVGYRLASNGLDAIQVEVGVNARQALSPILAAAAGTLIGAGTGTIIVKGGNVATTRITATTDAAGNRTSVTLSLPV